MPEARFDDQVVVLTGEAEQVLFGATEEEFASAGAIVERLDEREFGGAERLDVCICFARPRDEASLFIHSEDPAGPLVEALDRPLRASVAAATQMARAGGGALVIVGSLDVWHAYPGRAAAAVGMGGLLGLVRAMAVDLADKGVRANMVSVGPLASREPGTSDGQERLARTLQRSPMHRLCDPTEAAAAIRFVASTDSAFMTGQTLRVDGGWASLNQAPEGMRFP